MFNFIKPKSISEINLNSYISIIGLAPCKLFSILFEENFDNLTKMAQDYNITAFQMEVYLNILQASKLIQISIIGEQKFYEMFKPILLNGDENDKWNLIDKNKISISKGSNISKTYFDIFKKSFINDNLKNDNDWVTFFEQKNNNKKIAVPELILINQIQNDYNFSNDIIKKAIKRTFEKCQKWNSKYFSLVTKTFEKLKINTISQADSFFAGELFSLDNNAASYLVELENELEKLRENNV